MGRQRWRRPVTGSTARRSVEPHLYDFLSQPASGRNPCSPN
jgi:hypothetical protein